MEANEEVVVALVVVEFPVITRLPLMVDEAEERKPFVKVTSPVFEIVSLGVRTARASFNVPMMNEPCVDEA